MVDRYWIEGVDVSRLVHLYGTPLFVIHWPTLESRVRVLQEAFGGFEICYAVKANPLLEVVRRVISLGCGAETVSEGELFILDRTGMTPPLVLFDSVAPDRNAIRRALQMRALINADSFGVLDLVHEVAGELGMARSEYMTGIRVNPGMLGGRFRELTTASKASKFGEEPGNIEEYFRARSSGAPDGLHFHPGSQIEDESILLEGARRCMELADSLEHEGHEIEYVDFGGGFPVPYRPGASDEFFSAGRYASRLLELTHSHSPSNKHLHQGKKSSMLMWKNCRRRYIIEPGRFLTGPAGNLLVTVRFIKTLYEKRWALVDGGANLLLRAAYIRDWYHDIIPFRDGESLREETATASWSIGGPGCFGADTIGVDRKLPDLRAGDILAVQDAGAYCSSMTTTYCSLPLPAIVGVEADGETNLMQRRQRVDELMRFEAF